MTIDRRSILRGAAAVPMLAGPVFAGLGRARAQTAPLRIGVLTDLSSVYRDVTGPTSVACVRQAVQDYAAAQGLSVEVLAADHQNKPDVGAGIARQWFDRDGVDMITDVPNSAVALAVAQIAGEKNKAFVNSSMGVEFSTSPQCNANTVQWTYDVYAVAKSTAGALSQHGGDSWFFLTADYAFGKQLQQYAAEFATKNGAKVVGNVAYPFPSTMDFSSFLVQAQASGAKVLGLANAGADTVNCIKQAHEFGLTRPGGMRIAAMLLLINDVHALGLEATQGLALTNTYYWDLNDRTRAFNERVRSKTPDNWPCMLQAGCYAGSLHYMKAVHDMGVAAAKADGAATIARMKAMPTDDDCFGHGTIRADGRKLHPTYLWEVKTPAESKGGWDVYKPVATTPADQAFRPVSESACPLDKA